MDHDGEGPEVRDQLYGWAATMWWPERGQQVASFLCDLSREFAADVAQHVSVYEDPSLDLPCRRLMTIAILAALGRSRELRSHLLGALTNGIDAHTIASVMRQVGCYAGVPAAIDGFSALGKAEVEIANGAEEDRHLGVTNA